MSVSPERRQRNILIAVTLIAAVATVVLLFWVLMRTQNAAMEARPPSADGVVAPTPHQ